MISETTPVARRFLHLMTSTSSLSIVFRSYFVGMSFFITALLASILQPDSFGKYSFLMSVGVLVSGLAQAGAVPLIVRETARTVSATAVRSFVRRTLTLVLAFLTIGFLLYVVARQPARASLGSIALVYVLALTLCVAAIVSAALRGMGRTLVGQLSDRIIRPTLFVIAIGVTVTAGLSKTPEIMMLLHILAAFAGLGFVAPLYWRTLRNLPSTEPAPFNSHKWFRDMSRIALVTWIGVANAQIVLILTGLLVDNVAVGGFRIASQFAMLLALGLGAVEVVQAPRFSKFYRDGALGDVQSLIRTSSQLSLLIALPLAVLLLVAAEPLLQFFFSTAYVSVAPAIRILVIGQVVNALFGSVGTMLIACDLERSVVRATTAAFAAIVVLSVLLIPPMGIIGAAIATVLSLVLRNVWFAWIAHQKLGITPFPFGRHLQGSS